MDLWKNLPVGYEIMPTIEYYKAEKKYTDAVFIVFAGGGYDHLAKHEGEGYAKLFNVWGADAFVVNYSLSPTTFPAQINDARRAVQFVRANAKEYEVNPEKIIAVGSSAGGHLAATLSTYKEATECSEIDEISKINFFPDYQVLCYPVIDLINEGITHKGSMMNLLGENYSEELMTQLSPQIACNENTPPAFIWHNADDEVVHVYNSINYAKNLIKFNVPVELHLFPNGGHGVGIASNKHSGQWTELLFRWLREMKIY
ncbi:MAG: alpha/beta hydrolase [Ruminococcaceae bacterium]|nr:alpha/beta hydrolase [Oscillospiraceae bacterium]